MRKTISIIALILCIGAMIPMHIFAEEENGALDADNISIKGVHSVSNKDDLNTVNLTFVLKAKDPGNPMPEGSEDGIKKLVIPTNSEFDFGKLNFPKPGTYEYTVERELLNTNVLDQEDAVYDIKIAVFSDNTAIMIIKKSGEAEKQDKITYEDTYIKDCSLTFDLSGGKLNGETGKIVMHKNYGDVITIPEGPKKDNAEFLYWKGSKYYGGEEYTVTDDHKFTAIFKSDVLKSSKVKTGDVNPFMLLAGFIATVVVALIVAGRKNSSKK